MQRQAHKCTVAPALVWLKDAYIWACVYLFQTHTHTQNTHLSAARHMLSLTHAHKPVVHSLEMRTQVSIEVKIIISVTPWVMFSFTLRACQSAPLPASPLHPCTLSPNLHLITECRWCWHVTSGSSSLHVQHRHFSAHFPLPKRPDCEAPAIMWKRRQRRTEKLNKQMHSGHIPLPTLRDHVPLVVRKGRWKWWQFPSSHRLRSKSLTPLLLGDRLCVRSEESNLFSTWRGWDTLL